MHAPVMSVKECLFAQVREQRSANAAELRAAMADWSRRLHASGISERAQVRCWHVGAALAPAADCIATLLQ